MYDTIISSIKNNKSNIYFMEALDAPRGTKKNICYFISFGKYQKEKNNRYCSCIIH